MWDLIKLLFFIGIIMVMVKACQYMDNPELAGNDAARFGRAYNQAKKSFDDQKQEPAF
jgi:hypothetical protein